MAEARNPWLALVGRTLVDPRGAAEALLALRFNRGILWSLLVLVSILSVLVFKASLAVLPAQVSPQLAQSSPFALTIVLGAGLTMMVFAFYLTGQMLGGKGRFPGALLLMIWWQVMAMAIQIVQTLGLVLMPLIGGLISILGLGYLLYCLAVFVDAMHGFGNLFKALMTIVIASFGLLLGMSVILTLIGVTAAQGGLS